MKKLVILSGAGISKESGIPTFRDSDGLWNSVPIEAVCTPSALYQNPELVHEFYSDLKEEMLKTEPNSAHYACVELEKYYDVTVITQNVDNLHERAGSKKVIKIHGDLTKVRAVDDDKLVWTYLQPTTPETTIEGHHVRPHIVFFHETPIDFIEAQEEVRKADILVVIGTSLQVYPAAGLIENLMFDYPLYYIDPNPGKMPENCVADVKVIQKTATEGMKDLLKILINEQSN